MENKPKIFWFSGTGNSLYAAKQLSHDLVRITNETPIETFGGKIGFIFPSYYGNLPRAVKTFVEKLEIKPDAYIFAIVTMGGLGEGSIGVLDKILKAKGLHLSYGRGIHMPANYVINYNPANPEKSAKTLDKVDATLKIVAEDITSEKQLVKKNPVAANNLYKNIEKLDVAFNANKNCTGCGLCARICPVANIRLTDEKPEWLHRCEHCVACISWCPKKAIDYGNKTQKRRRYRNPWINVTEIIV